MFPCPLCDGYVEESECLDCQRKIKFYKCPKCDAFIRNPRYQKI